jgi:putative toxin-antitoxin system antitoxin component (TIGR02293 family)
MATTDTLRQPPAKPAKGFAPARPRFRAASAEPRVVYGGLDEFVGRVSHATPFQLVELERHGVEGRFLKDVSKRLDVPQMHVFDMLGVPKATAEKKVAAGQVISGSGGQAAIGMAKLIAKAQEIVANSTAAEAQDFDAAKWLGKWLDVPQPALGGRKPSALLDTPTGLDVVLKVLGAIESGAYQ